MSKINDQEYFDAEEKEEIESIEAAIEDGSIEFLEGAEKEEVLDMLQQAAINTIALRKAKNINLRMTEQDVSGLKSRAAEAGIPYQTLASMVLHQVATGKIKITI